MSALAAQISETEAQLADARAKGQRERAARLERRLERMWETRRQSLARSRNDGDWSYCDPAVFRRRTP